MDIEGEQLLRDLQRFRHLLSVNTDPQARALIAEMIAIAEERLRIASWKVSASPRSTLH
jgi:hypothetical protein